MCDVSHGNTTRRSPLISRNRLTVENHVVGVQGSSGSLLSDAACTRYSHLKGKGPTIFEPACALGLERIVPIARGDPLPG